MPTQRVYAVLMLCTFFLFSCNRKKTTTAPAAAAIHSDTMALQPDEMIGLTGCTNDYISNATQKFIAPAQKISRITAKKGLQVTVDPAVLEKEDGTVVDEKIVVSIIELTSSEELFKSNAATVSNGRLLSSGGSYFIGMESGGQPLHIKSGNRLQVSFPKIKDNNMELFYGNRDSTASMNWIKANEPLEQLVFSDTVNYADYNPPYRDTVAAYNSSYHLYGSLNDKVLFADKPITLMEMVKLLQKKNIDKHIDSFYLDWDDFKKAAVRRDYEYEYTSYPYRKKVYRIISCRELEAEKDSLDKESKIKQAHDLANKKYDEVYYKAKGSQSLTGQLEKYYAPASVTKLGWINCDRFYNCPENIDIPLDLPVTFNSPVIQYFIIYQSFNGLLNGQLAKSNMQQYVLTKLPLGQPVILVAFTKINGQLFHCREEFVIEKNKKLKLDFKNISVEEMHNIFGKNVHI